jgi:hypothetical protein
LCFYHALQSFPARQLLGGEGGIAGGGKAVLDGAEHAADEARKGDLVIHDHFISFRTVNGNSESHRDWVDEGKSIIDRSSVGKVGSVLLLLRFTPGCGSSSFNQLKFHSSAMPGRSYLN